MKIHIIPVFLHFFWFFLRKFSKNSNLRAKTSNVRMKNICGEISNKFVDFLGFENALL